MEQWINRGWVLVALMLSACAGQEGQHFETDLSEQLQALDADLGSGSTGAGVRAVQRYLAEYGFLPNADLQADRPAWRPLVGREPVAGSYDDATADAVRQLQLSLNLPQTGVVDAATRRALSAPRCGVPEGIARIDPSSKYDITAGPSFSTDHRTVTWRWVTFPPRGSAADTSLGGDGNIRYFTEQAFQTWSTYTGLTFNEVDPSVTADLTFDFVPDCPIPAPEPAPVRMSVGPDGCEYG